MRKPFRIGGSTRLQSNRGPTPLDQLIVKASESFAVDKSGRQKGSGTVLGVTVSRSEFRLSATMVPGNEKRFVNFYFPTYLLLGI
jgi:hypothetical protein